MVDTKQQVLYRHHLGHDVPMLNTKQRTCSHLHVSLAWPLDATQFRDQNDNPIIRSIASDLPDTIGGDLGGLGGRSPKNLRWETAHASVPPYILRSSVCRMRVRAQSKKGVIKESRNYFLK